MRHTEPKLTKSDTISGSEGRRRSRLAYREEIIGRILKNNVWAIVVNIERRRVLGEQD